MERVYIRGHRKTGRFDAQLVKVASIGQTYVESGAPLDNRDSDAPYVISYSYLAVPSVFAITNMYWSNGEFAMADFPPPGGTEPGTFPYGTNKQTFYPQWANADVLPRMFVTVVRGKYWYTLPTYFGGASLVDRYNLVFTYEER